MITLKSRYNLCLRLCGKNRDAKFHRACSIVIPRVLSNVVLSFFLLLNNPFSRSRINGNWSDCSDDDWLGNWVSEKRLFFWVPWWNPKTKQLRIPLESTPIFIYQLLSETAWEKMGVRPIKTGVSSSMCKVNRVWVVSHGGDGVLDVTSRMDGPSKQYIVFWRISLCCSP